MAAESSKKEKTDQSTHCQKCGEWLEGFLVCSECGFEEKLDAESEYPSRTIENQEQKNDSDY